MSLQLVRTTVPLAAALVSAWILDLLGVGTNMTVEVVDAKETGVTLCAVVLTVIVVGRAMAPEIRLAVKHFVATLKVARVRGRGLLGLLGLLDYHFRLGNILLGLSLASTTTPAAGFHGLR